MARLERADVLPLLAGLAVLAVFGWWMADDGGYAATVWMPGLAVVAAVLVLVVGVAGRPSRSATIACSLLAAYTAWSFASILWADAPGPALEGSQRTLLYVLCFACFALLAWTPRALLVLVGLYVLTISALGILALVQVAQAADPAPLLFESRLLGSFGYPNASAALWTSGALSALVLAARPETIRWLRPLSLGACALLLGLAALAQSRGWLFTLPVVLLALLVLVPGRARLVLFAALPAWGLAFASGALAEPYRAGAAARRAGTVAELGPAIDHAAQSLALATAAVVVVGALAVWLDGWLARRVTLSPRAGRVLTGGLLGCLAVGCIAVAMVATDGRPVQRVALAWEQLKGYHGESGGENRFAALGSNRYDIWRVALETWRERPVSGLGQDNFAQPYVGRRANAFDEPRWIHSLPLRLLSHTGLVGLMLFALFTIAAARATMVAWSSPSAAAGGRAAGSLALVPATVWIAHGSVDWLWEYPGLSGPALALAGAATGLWRGTADRSPPPERRSRRGPVALASVAALTCIAIVLPSYIAERDVREAAAHWPADPGVAFDRLARARRLNPLSARPSLVEGVIAVHMGRLGLARIGFERAAKREPHDWFARFELGLLAGARHDRGAALDHLSAARRLNPRERLVLQALDLARRGRFMPMLAAQQEVGTRIQQRR